MEDGEISYNTANADNSAGGVFVAPGASFTMNGGKISNNQSRRGGGVLLYGQNGNSKEYASFTMSDGTISGNVATGGAVNGAGGGVYVMAYASFTMNDGTISSNQSSSGVGGGVAVTCRKDGNKICDEANAGVFTMNGGTITGNRASDTGGGVYSDSKNVVLNAGEISDNIAGRHGGGVYVSVAPFTATLNNALITGNTADVMGGGVWTCPTGSLTVGEGNAAIFGNSSKGAGDDVVSLYKGNEAASTTLPTVMLGGANATWYEDGKVMNGSLTGEILGAVVETTPRFNETVATAVDAGQLKESKYMQSLKAVVSEDAKAEAKRAAQLIITGNHASRGGGVGGNGAIIMPGQDIELLPVKVSKTWSVPNGVTHPESVTVDLKRGNEVIASVILSASSGWEHTFYVADIEGLSVVEHPVGGYESEVTGDTVSGFVVTNTYTTKPGPGPGPGPDPEPDPEDNPTDIPEEDVPLTDLPEEDVPLTDLPEEDVPLTDLPEEDVPLTDLPEEDVPLTDLPTLPQTGVNLLPAMLLAMSGTITAAAGLLLDKKKKDED